ncbi:HAD-IA family hydrolase, partial [Omnitrophica bacterium]|nr:HAD-IA family hydrolase [Candidatus Omnitrophota bacterium]
AATKKQGYFLRFLEADGITVYETTRRLIEELRSNNIKIAVISSSKNCPYVLERAGLRELLDTVISGKDIKEGKGKPDPWIFLRAVERLGLKPDECIVFEDAVLGVEAGKRANMKTIGIDRHNDPNRLMKADLIIKDAQEVDYNKLKSLVEK